MIINYALILTVNYPGKEWSLYNNDYDTLQWYSDTTKPSKQELDALWQSTNNVLDAQEQAQTNAKQSALNKLMALGLTEEEALALGK
jgi:hypothetical protein